MIRYLYRRLAASLLLIFLVLTLTFFIVRLAPGDPTAFYDNNRLSEEYRENLRRVYGLDKPLGVQYVLWLRQVLQGDWGVSFSHQRPAVEVVAQALPYTLLLGVAALLCQYGVGLLLGVYAARRAGGAGDHWVLSVSLILYSIPAFWSGLMLILLFHLQWGILPASGVASVEGGHPSILGRALDTAQHLVLPLLTLTLVSAGRVARFVRNSLLETLSADFIRTAQAKGVSARRVLWVHGVRNSLVSVAQLFGLSLPAALNGILVIEVVFAWPGLGRILFDACMARDYPVILLATALSATLVILGSLLADLLHSVLDPRVRHG
jgi:peptide/nickel transport system permease protein